MYHIQISVYVKADTIYGAKAAAMSIKNCIPDAFSSSGGLDEVIIHSVIKEKSSCDCEFGYCKCSPGEDKWKLEIAPIPQNTNLPNPPAK